MLKDHPNLATGKEQSLNARNNLLRKDAADLALQEWSQPRSKITHLIFHTASGCVDMSGPDYRLVNLLGLDHKVDRYILYNNY